jgi:hypothetical protein
MSSLYFVLQAPDNLECLGIQLTRLEAMLVSPESHHSENGETADLCSEANQRRPVDKCAESHSEPHGEECDLNMADMSLKESPSLLSKEDGVEITALFEKPPAPLDDRQDPVKDVLTPGRG